MKNGFVIMAIALTALTGCATEPGELSPAGGSLPFSGGNSGGNSGSYTAPAPAKNLVPMMQDPEGNLEDSGIEFVAANETEALNKCQKQATSLSSADTIVSCLGCRKRTKTTNKFICTMRTEVVPLAPKDRP